MNILMVGNICSTDIIADCINRLGHNCKILITSDDGFGQRYDYCIPYDRSKKFETVGKMISSANLASEYDVVHWHSGVARTRADFLIMKMLYSIPMVVNYHGSESRMGYGMYYKTLADKKVVSTPDLLHWHPDARFITNPVPLYDNSYDMDVTPRIVHLPTLKHERGTYLINEAVKELMDENVKFVYKEIENHSHSAALDEISRSHIVIDALSKDINYQVFGLVSLEAMSMGKVAVCHMDNNYMDFFPGCPVVNPDATVDNLKVILRGLIETPEGCRSIGRKGRNYVQRNHDPMMVARQFLDVYKEVLN